MRFVERRVGVKSVELQTVHTCCPWVVGLSADEDGQRLYRGGGRQDVGHGDAIDPSKGVVSEGPVDVAGLDVTEGGVGEEIYRVRSNDEDAIVCEDYLDAMVMLGTKSYGTVVRLCEKGCLPDRNRPRLEDAAGAQRRQFSS